MSFQSLKRSGKASGTLVSASAPRSRSKPSPLPGRQGCGRPGPDRHRQDRRFFDHPIYPSPGEQGSTQQPRALILAPTRELVVQIEADAQLLGRHCGLVTQAIYGGVDYMKQRSALREGADVVVGTPGRLIDYLKQKVYSLKGLRCW